MDIKDLTYNQFAYERKKQLRNITYLKSYGGKFFKLIVLKGEFNGGVRTFSEKNTVNDEKLTNNLIRGKSRVFEIAVCNDWGYFVTLTLDSKKYDRYNLKNYIKDLSQFIRNQRRIKGVDLKYLLVPEQHKDGAWHLHGLIKGIPQADIVPNGNKGNDGQEYMHWLPYFNKFGYMSLDTIKDSVKASFYLRKYITKTMLDNNIQLGAHSYYASQGLKGADDLQSIKGYDLQDYKFCYTSDFVDVANLSVEEAQELLKNNQDME